MKKLVLVILIAGVLLLAAGAGYFFFLRPEAGTPFMNVTNDTSGPMVTNGTTEASQEEPGPAPTIIDILPLPERNTTDPVPESEVFLYHNLSNWFKEDLFDAMEEELPGLSLLQSYSLKYSKDNESQYTYNSARNHPVREDPFWIIRSKYSAGVVEYPDLYDWRINVPITTEAFYSEVLEKRNDTRLRALYPEAYAEWMNINCERILSCRDIFAIICAKENSTLVMWTPLEANAGRQGDITFSMQGNLKLLSAFERLYCEPIT